MLLWDRRYEDVRRFGTGEVWREAGGFRLNAPASRAVTLGVEGVTHIVTLPEDWERVPIDAERRSGGAVVFSGGDAFFVSAARVGGDAAAAAGDGAIISPMPGKIIALEVAQGEAVTKGQKLLTLEAMKMEHSLTAPFDGMVAELSAVEGAQVSEGALLARVEKGE